jgi:hypothetical protein
MIVKVIIVFFELLPFSNICSNLTRRRSKEIVWDLVHFKLSVEALLIQLEHFKVLETNVIHPLTV